MTLSEKDRRSLMVMAQELRADDPRLAESLTAGTCPSKNRGLAWTVTIVLIVVAVKVLLGCLTDRPAGSGRRRQCVVPVVGDPASRPARRDSPAI